MSNLFGRTICGKPLDLDSSLQANEMRIKTDADGKLTGFVAHPDVVIALSLGFYNPGDPTGVRWSETWK